MTPAEASSTPARGEQPGWDRVCDALAAAGHPASPRWLTQSARTCAEAAAALGVETGRIAKSVVFRREADDMAVVVVASGDRRVDAAKVAALAGPVRSADAGFVKQATGFSIGGVAPVGHARPVQILLDRELGRFETVWAAAGHPNGVFEATLAQLQQLTQATPQDIALT